ncbi:MAG: DUF1573 domain-containing protein [Thermoguttaceae bacterium]|nr:DUF1573 domain-containing protein [Thermoguttaceae bacterium]
MSGWIAQSVAIGLAGAMVVLACPAWNARGDALSACAPEEFTLFNGNEADLGRVDPSVSEVALTFRWPNKSGRTLRIKNIALGCKCASVTPSSKVIPPGSSVDLLMKIDVRNMDGHGGSAFVVEFAETDMGPEKFSAVLYKAMPARAEPPEIDFGAVGTVDATRQFAVVGVNSVRDGPIEIAGEAASTDKRVTCTFLHGKQTRFRSANAAADTVRYIATFEAKARGMVAPASLEGQIRIPIRSGRVESTIVVPFSGRYPDSIIACPSRVVVLAPASERSRTVSIDLSRGVGGGSSQGEIACRCTDARIRLRFVRAVEGSHDDSLGRVVAEIDLSGNSSFDATIEVFQRPAVRGVAIPVRVRVLK